MSGITPIIDTLLHQVLGKRADLPAPKVLNEPVKPMSPGEAPRAVHSDSRLNGRSPVIQDAVNTAGNHSAPSGTATAQEPPPASSQTQFSQAARTIADILVKFPAPPSVLRPAQPLIAAPELSTPSLLRDPVLLAERLQGSIQSSGLFYESHLARWHRGELPRQALELEPQMSRPQALRAAASDAALLRQESGPPQPSLAIRVEGAINPAGSSLLSGVLKFSAPFLPLSPSDHNYRGMSPGKAEATVAYSPASLTAQSSPLSSGGYTALTSMLVRDGVKPDSAGSVTADTFARHAPMTLEPLSEALQGVVRHQLEMLVSPVLRWEGDVWSGIFMALMIHVPESHEHTHGQTSEQEGGGSDQQAWHTEMTLKLPALGEIDVDLRLKRDKVAVTLSCENSAVVERLDGGQERLRQRLLARGFTDVALRVNLKSEGELS
ncbi:MULTISPECIES: flagellar hook-length control protein FliK [Halomonadaceae]|uniref:flagellar hook-length control protein FliK n=1 Tax=Halomonadaceae TaxID=28256 RepID=UPI0015987AE4|nr:MULTISPECIES: flagellar hook-length control protein FliK [unclassified Halomonas]QJQ96558.1 flagellar hook-length control protein FliK [Halomonas sp. PA5]